MSYSHALLFARRIAGGEATQLGHTRLGPEHLLLGLCKLEDPLAQGLLAQTNLSPQALTEARQEISSLLNIFAQIGLSPAHLRRGLRERIAGRHVDRAGGSMLLTSDAEALFAAAEQIARAARAASINTAHLLAAISAAPGPVVRALLNEANVNLADLHQLTNPNGQQGQGGRDGMISHSVRADEPPFASSARTTTGAAAKRAMRRLQAFYQIAQAVAAATLSDELFSVIAREIQLVLPQGVRGAIVILSETGDLQQRVNWPPNARSVNRQWAEQAMQERKAFIWQAKAPELDRLPVDDLSTAVRAAIYAPLICADKLLGVLYVDSCEHTNAFTPDDLEMVHAVANQVSVAVFNQRLRQERERLAVVRANLGRHFPPIIVERLIAHLSAPDAEPVWSKQGVVVAVRLQPPPGLTPGERMVRQNELGLSVAHQLLTFGASISWSGAPAALVAVFAPDPAPALRAAWALSLMGYVGGWTLSVGLEWGELAQHLLAPEPVQPDLFSPYERALHIVCSQTVHNHPGIEELLIYQQRLTENIRYARLFTDPDARRAERNEILNGLNRWALRYLGVSFNELCGVQDVTEAALVVPEYHVAGLAVEVAHTLAHAAPPGALFLGPNAYRTFSEGCQANFEPQLNAYVVTALC